MECAESQEESKQSEYQSSLAQSGRNGVIVIKNAVPNKYHRQNKFSKSALVIAQADTMGEEETKQMAVKTDVPVNPQN